MTHTRDFPTGIGPHSPKHPRQDLRDLLGAGDTARAAREIHQALAENPDDPDLLILLAQADRQRGALIAAQSHLLRALEADPTHQEASAFLHAVREDMAAGARQEYALAFHREKHRFMDFPKRVAIEVTGKCNGDCVFCPHAELQRRGSDMDQELFEKILHDLADIPRDRPLHVYTHLVCEPFLDKRIFERLARINEKLPQATLSPYSNFNWLPKGFFQKIRKIENIEFINVSMNGATAEDYTRRMGLDFEATVKNVRQLLKENRKDRITRHPVLISRIREAGEDEDTFAADVAALFPEFEPGRDFNAFSAPRADWLGGVDGGQSPVPFDLPCSKWLELNVFCDGTVPFCCMDAHGQHPLGNAQDSHLLDIYNTPHFRFLRERNANRETSFPCCTCALR